MKVLYVGCRVRILYSTHFPFLAGKEGLIIERHVDDKGEWIVSVDEWGGPYCPFPIYIPEFRSNMSGVRFGPFSEQLEPILLPGVLDEVLREETITA